MHQHQSRVTAPDAAKSGLPQEPYQAVSFNFIINRDRIFEVLLIFSF